MTYYVEDRGRIGQSAYWMYFGAYLILTPLLLIGGGYEIMTGAYVSGAVAIMLILPLSLYFRVIVMRRCRDIGWPAFLPWLTMGLSFVVGFTNAYHAGTNPLAAASAIGKSMGLSLMIGFIDLALQVVVGCIASKDGGISSLFDDDDFDPRDLPQAPRGYVDGLKPLGRSEPARPIRAEPAISMAPAPRQQRVPDPAPTPRATPGFGRRPV